MKNNNKRRLQSSSGEDGFVLVIALVMMTVLSIIGIAALNTTTIELQISGNDRQEKRIFYGTESGCRRGGQWIRNLQLVQIDDYVDSDIMTTYLADQNFNDAMKVRDITKTEEANLGDAAYAIKYEYNIAESQTLAGTRLDCLPKPGNGPGILDCNLDVSCNSATVSGGSRFIDIRVVKPTDFN